MDRDAAASTRNAHSTSPTFHSSSPAYPFTSPPSVLAAVGQAVASSSNDTSYVFATATGLCQQIPRVLLNETVFCHGPFPKPSWGAPCSPPDCMPDWQSGSCRSRGYSSLQGQAANATGQTDPFKCDFKGWDFKHQLPASQSRTQWVKSRVVIV